MRIGIYGGAFDPPHKAHLGLARAAVEQLALNRLYVIPTGQPWMKQRRLTAAEHRLAMARLAFESVPEVQVDDCEVQREGTTYTIDTLHELQQRHAALGEQEAMYFHANFDASGERLNGANNYRWRLPPGGVPADAF